MKTLSLYTSARNVGKSTWNQMIQSLIPPDVKTLTSAEVDGKMWYTVKLTIPAREWLRLQPADEWYEHVGLTQYFDGSCFDVSEQLYTALKLKWT